MDNNYRKIKDITYVLSILAMITAYFSADLKCARGDTQRRLFYIMLHIGIIVVADIMFVMYSKQEGLFYKKLKSHTVIIMAVSVFMLINRLFFAGMETGTITLPTSPWNSMNTGFFLDCMYIFICALPMYEFYSVKKFSEGARYIRREQDREGTDE